MYCKPLSFTKKSETRRREQSELGVIIPFVQKRIITSISLETVSRSLRL